MINRFSIKKAFVRYLILGIAIALLGSSDLLILDEPMNELDPEGIREIRGFIQKLKKKKI